MYHLDGEINKCFHASVTFQCMFVCSFGVDKFIEETNRDVEGEMYPKPLSHLLELLCALLQRCLRFSPHFSQVMSLALTLLLRRYSEQLSVYSLI